MISSAELQATHRARRIRLQKSTIIAVCLRVTDIHYKHIVYFIHQQKSKLVVETRVFLSFLKFSHILSKTSSRSVVCRSVSIKNLTSGGAEINLSLDVPAFFAGRPWLPTKIQSTPILVKSLYRGNTPNPARQ
uniref:(northern house mosquito) hypothetical protein n=2 Tax=Culex pipiens TaxID=7175 RepID=A0A8D8GWH1_CULPI